MHRTYYDPDTGETIIIIDDDDDEYRNASRDHRSGGGGRHLPSADRPPTSGSMAPRSRSSTGVVRRRRQPPTMPAPVEVIPAHSGEYLAIRKAAIAQLIPTLGDIWSAFLLRPDLPEFVGDAESDFTNEALHRDALANHTQNQTRIRTLSSLAGRAVNLLMD